MVLGATAVARRVPRRRLAAGALVALAVQGAGMGLQTAWAILPVAVAGYLVGGVGHGVKNVLLRALLVVRVPAAVHGRAFAAYNAARSAAELCALGAGGVLVGALGPRAALVRRRRSDRSWPPRRDWPRCGGAAAAASRSGRARPRSAPGPPVTGAQDEESASALTVCSARPSSTSSLIAAATSVAEFSNTSGVTPAVCGMSVTLRSSRQRESAGQRLVLVDVERGARDALLGHGVVERVVVDHPAARVVDEVGARLHQRELLGADEAARLLAEPRVQRDDVALAEDPLEVRRPSRHRAPRSPARRRRGHRPAAAPRSPTAGARAGGRPRPGRSGRRCARTARTRGSRTAPASRRP